MRSAQQRLQKWLGVGSQNPGLTLGLFVKSATENPRSYRAEWQHSLLQNPPEQSEHKPLLRRG